MSTAKHESARKLASPRKLVRYIDPAWQARSRVDQNLQRDLAGVLGPYLATRRVAVTAADDTLIVACMDRSGATELRFQQREILKTLQATGNTGIERVRVLLAAPQARRPVPDLRRVQREIPAAAREALQATARATEDPALAAALQRLARVGLGG